MKISWKGKGLKEKAYYKNKIIISIDKKYFRPTEVVSLWATLKKQEENLNGNLSDITSLAKNMVNEEIKRLTASK